MGEEKRERQREREEGKWEEGRERKRGRKSYWKQKENLPASAEDGGGSGQGLSLKGTRQAIHYIPLSFL